MSDFSVVTLGGLRFASLTESEVVRHVRVALRRGVGGRIATPNIDILRQVAGDPSLHAQLLDADLLVADGAPLVWAARLAGRPLPERVTGSGLIWSLSAGLARDGRSVYLLGGNPGEPSGAARAAMTLSRKYPGLRIAGHTSPPFGFDRDSDVFRSIVASIVISAPDLVFVGLGYPKQERIIDRLRPEMPTTWFLGCGAAINFVAGDQARAPRWMQRSGLEWAHRLVSEPRRLAGRYLRHDAPFAFRLLATAVLAGRTSTASAAVVKVDTAAAALRVGTATRHTVPGTARSRRPSPYPTGPRPAASPRATSRPAP